jgi:magnesium chelatase family protein
MDFAELSSMIIRSLVNNCGKLQSVEVEIELTPGLPQMHFLGLADQGIKESIYRIRCAIRKQGFKYPRSHQILVNLRPAHFKKNSRGLELAVAAGLLAKTGQIAWPKMVSLVYGELSLGGEVTEPEDLKLFQPAAGEVCLTGSFNSEEGKTAGTQTKFVVSNLRGLKAPQYVPAQVENHKWQRPREYSAFEWSEEQARWLQIMAVGGHHSLLAGASGIGKTTLAKTLNSLLPPPESKWAGEYKTYFDLPSWRPLAEPHHTISTQGLLGGGVPLVAGEITRAHGGILILDELLEFDPATLEALREPIEEGLIRLRKRNIRETFPAQFQLVATTNLCPCGDWVPGKKRNCHYSKAKCLSTFRRVTGPFLDRFQILYFVKKAKNMSSGSDSMRSQEILAKLEGIFEFQKGQYRVDLNSRRAENHLEVSSNLIKLHGLEEVSPRRRISTLRVARTLADLEYQEVIRSHHIEEARLWTIFPFQALKQGSPSAGPFD